MIEDLLDFRQLFVDGDKFNFEYKETTHDPITDTYTQGDIKSFDVNSILKEKYKSQFLKPYKNYLEAINRHKVITQAKYSKIEETLFNFQFDLNHSTGLSKKIWFLIKTYADALGYHFVEVYFKLTK